MECCYCKKKVDKLYNVLLTDPMHCAVFADEICADCISQDMKIIGEKCKDDNPYVFSEDINKPDVKTLL